MSGGLLGPLLSPSWGLCWRSWAALGANVRDLGSPVGGLGPLLGPLLAVLGRLEPKSVPNPSGKAFLERKQKSIFFWPAGGPNASLL